MASMELIPSFQVDHTKILPGIYVSRTDDISGHSATTFDIRMKRPNLDTPIEPASMHTIEHVVATFLRNDPAWKNEIIYFGPMGCLTGCYLIVKGAPKPEEIAPLLVRAFRHLAEFEGDVPGATSVNCGNYALHDLFSAKKDAAEYAALLESSPCYEYPTSERIEVDGGRVFYDS